jgi:alginate O-acetyltransferase complex protein AlgI
MGRSYGFSRKLLLIAGITSNLAALAYFKYAYFIVENINALITLNVDLGEIILPLAISFFTFQQITFLVDTYQNQTSEHDFSRYCLFVLFFPQLIAGPIVHHKEMMPQFSKQSLTKNISDNFNAGITLFSIGLFKKVMLADNLALIANPAFRMAELNQELSFSDAWFGATAYSFQLYFDFSGYSEMALGIAIMFGIRLPLNFFSPYKSKSIIEFWQRWHMTLSRFLKDYLYIPLGGNRNGGIKRYRNLLLTMLLGGIWHGAGWAFLIWGALHGFFLVVNHGWRAFSAHKPNQLLIRFIVLLSPLITFFCVVLAWVFFRAESINGAIHMLSAMFQLDVIATSEVYLRKITQLPLLDLIKPITGSAKSLILFATLILSAAIIFLLPNTVELMQKGHPALDKVIFDDKENSRFRLQWHATPAWQLIIAILLSTTLLSSAGVSPFLYFQF